MKTAGICVRASVVCLCADSGAVTPGVNVYAFQCVCVCVCADMYVPTVPLFHSLLQLIAHAERADPEEAALYSCSCLSEYLRWHPCKFDANVQV